MSPTPVLSHHSRSTLGVLLLSALALSGCHGTPPGAGPQGGPPEVGVVTLAPRAVGLVKELPGRTAPFRIAEVRARVSGIVVKRQFTEGSLVREGQPLFQLDPAPYEAALDQAQAQQARAAASLSSARTEAKRAADLLEGNATSRQVYDNAMAALQVAEADVAAARAAVRTASINLGYTRVTAPISGFVGRAAVTEGAYAQQAQATLLATIQQLDPIYVDLSESSAELARLSDDLETGRLRRAADGGARVKLLLEDGRAYRSEGRLQFTDVTIDPGTSSLTVRAVFPNPRRTLLPGAFVRAQLDEGENPNALLVPQAAVTRDARGQATVLLVNREQKVEPRPVTLDRESGGDWIVAAGLGAGDRVIVDGLQKVRPGMPVQPVPFAPTAAR